MGLKKIYKSSLFKASGLYTVSSVLNAAIPFLLIPILTRELGAADYGIVSMAAILINILTPFMGLSGNGAVQRKYYEVDQKAFAKYIGNAFYILVGSALSFLLLFIVFNKQISSLTEVPGKWLYAILIIAISQFISLLLLTIWQVTNKPIKYGVFQITQSIVNFGLTLLLVVLFKMDWEGRILGQLGALVVGALFCIQYMYRKSYVDFTFDWNEIKDILRFSLPLIPHTLGGLLIAFTDRLLITNMIGIEETGVYTVAYQIGSVLGVVTSSFNNAYVPWLFTKLKAGIYDDKIKIVKFTYAYFAILLLIAVTSAYLLPWFISIIAGKAFESAGSYTFWIVLGYAFNGMYFMVTGFVFYTKKTGLLSKVTFFVAIVNFPLCYFLLKSLGTVGAAISMTIVFGLSFILTWVLSARVFPMPWFFFLDRK